MFTLEVVDPAGLVFCADRVVDRVLGEFDICIDDVSPNVAQDSL